MKVLKDLLYTKTHEWVKFEDETTAEIGLTDYAQDSLGGIVFVNFPEEEDEVTAGEVFADVESVKAVSDVYSPVTGVVAKVNEELLDSPEIINDEPYEAWFVKITDITEKEEFLSPEEYETFVEKEQEE
ncbi:glycine cleavage system protein GcvH [Blautia liquoris]|uniref:Glycine cleavage system H protein n=1 Tax=Blautia liquoris TaxID=2779518 RepID=A0A7M2RE28_9FIRM|nr:glycine cleavage system protein GcvH [Blautia liquoris]QOV18398.1 glycine cleavage system protein GcvH [Blautia liquoris]